MPNKPKLQQMLQMPRQKPQQMLLRLRPTCRRTMHRLKLQLQLKLTRRWQKLQLQLQLPERYDLGPVSIEKDTTNLPATITGRKICRRPSRRCRPNWNLAARS